MRFNSQFNVYFNSSRETADNILQISNHFFLLSYSYININVYCRMIPQIIIIFFCGTCMSTLKNIATILQALYEDQGKSCHFTLSSCDVSFFMVAEYRLHYHSLCFIKNILFTTTHRATLWSTQSSIPWLPGGSLDYNIHGMKFTHTSLTLQLTMP